MLWGSTVKVVKIDWSCVNNYTHDFPSVTEMKQELFQGMNAVLLILLMHMLAKHLVQIC